MCTKHNLQDVSDEEAVVNKTSRMDLPLLSEISMQYGKYFPIN